jgi:RNA polymerase sigma-70 factor (ECF subfamily)
MLRGDPPVAEVVACKAAGAPLDEAIATLDAAEVFLAAALLGGDQAAPAAFEQRYFSAATSVLERAGATHDEADEVLQTLRARLLVSADGGTPRLVDYCGNGRLPGLLRIAATRALMNMRDKRKPESDLDALAEQATADLDPQRAILEQQESDAIAGAIRSTARALPRRSRTLLRLNLVEGLSIDELGRVFGLHRATAARQLARARDELIAGVRQRLVELWGEGAAALELVSARLEITLGGALATGSTWRSGKPPLP